MGMVNVKCFCGKDFKARQADINRGWGKFCSKSCKARKQESRTGQYANFIHQTSVRVARAYGGVDRETYEHYQNEYGGTPQFDRNGNYTGFTMSPEELASGGYNNAGPDDPFGDGKW